MKPPGHFDLVRAIEILEKTPTVLQSMLSGLSESWLHQNEGGDSWSPFIILGHLIHGEITDWIPRAKTILEFGEAKTFDAFDRFAQFDEVKGKSVEELLQDFRRFRAANVRTLIEMKLTEDDFARTGTHPDFGCVTLQQLLATWVVHDLGHIRQIARVMAKQYKTEVGPWEKYLPVVHE